MQVRGRHRVVTQAAGSIALPGAGVIPGVPISRIALGVLIKWSKHGNRRLVLYLEVDRDEGEGFRFLALDTEPDYTYPVTAAATWKYRAQYRLGDVPTGEWSDVVSVVVG